MENLKRQRVRLEALESAWKEYLHFQDQIELMVDVNEFEDEQNNRMVIEEKYFNLKSQILQIIEKCQQSSVASQPNSVLEQTLNTLSANQVQLTQALKHLTVNSSQGRSSNNESVPVNYTRLPKIDVPHFYGSYLEWKNFSDLFVALIDKNQNLSQAEKLQYLKSCLKGDASTLLNHLTVCDANYAPAWEELKSRFDKERYIVDSILKTLCSQASITSPTAQSIKILYNTSTECVRALKAMNYPVDQWDAWLVFMITSKFDNESKLLWTRFSVGKERPKFEDICKFLLEREFELSSNCSDNKTVKGKPTRHTYIAKVVSCPNCSSDHGLYKCLEFLKWEIQQKREFVKQKKLCFNCLKMGHQARQCTSILCKICQKRHHTVLHCDDKMINSSKDKVVCATANLNQLKYIILPTAIVLIQDRYKQLQPCRILLDTGSQVSLISEACVQRLGLKRKRSNTEIHGIGETKSEPTKGSIQINIKSRLSNYSVELNAFILSKLTSFLPSVNITNIKWSEINNVQLADPTFTKPGKIDIIAGCDLFFHILQPEKMMSPMNNLIAQNTLFGWIITGSHDQIDIAKSSCYHIQVDLNDQLKRFWELENIDNSHSRTREEDLCENHFINTHQRLHDGKYLVRLPFIENIHLGNSKETALKRFFYIEQRLAKNHQLRNEYTTFMKEYETLGHMRKLTQQEKLMNAEDSCYLPHHPVFKPTSTTTKLRVVFDASCLTSSGYSLNDSLMIGAVIQPDLFQIILQFRLYPVAFTADIAKMYRQIKMHDSDANYQRIIWRNHPSSELQEYQLQTVTYGTASAPFLATRVLYQLSIDEEHSYPNAAKLLRSHFYIDDLMAGATSVDEAKTLVCELIQLLAKGGFELRKWSANVDHILGDASVHDTPINLTIEKTEGIKTLGLIWYPHSDYFAFNVKFNNASSTSKRQILSEIARIFDPIGWLTPVIVNAKIFLQELWNNKLDWDDQLNENLLRKWVSIRNDLTALENIKITRWSNFGSYVHELHCFTDASQKAYAAVVYLRTVTPEQQIIVRIIAAKSRVSPLKEQSIPRLELCAAQLGAKLIQKVMKVFTSCKVYAWTDSQIVLAWLSDSSKRWKCFVANRVNHIKSIMPSLQWNYVMSADNPADCASRGIRASKLVNYDLWWNGPAFLHQLEFQSPENVRLDNIEVPEQRIIHFVETDDCILIIKRFSSFRRMIRVIGWCYRFFNNTKQEIKNRASFLSAEEQNCALHCCIRIEQSQFFSNEILDCKQDREMQRSSKLLRLDPFLDNNDILRVGGRLQFSTLEYNQRHQIILHNQGHIAWLIVLHYHCIYFHAGSQLLQNLLRSKYWIIGDKHLIKKVIHSCVVCQRYAAKTSQQKMGNLPPSRLEPGRVFANVGVDFAGPFYVLSRRGRGVRAQKVYVSLFVCLATRALHLEMVSDLSTNAFMAAFNRFTSRRGLPKQVYSDNGTNFVGASKELKELYRYFGKTQVKNQLSSIFVDIGVQWHFIPPAAPNFGGIWEAGVKSMKHHLRRTIGNSHLTAEEFSTLLCKIEATLNSRPLSPVSDCIDDLEPLTPAHFLIGGPLQTVPEIPLDDFKLNRLSRWQYINRLNQSFWRRWHNDYLHQLQQRNKWMIKRENMNIGTLVLIKDEDTPPATWFLGRIVQIHPGSDGLVRVVSIKTKSGIMKRPISKLCPLKLD